MFLLTQVGPYRQSERGEIYKKMADKLVEAGLAYPCFCTEEELIAKREQVMRGSLSVLRTLQVQGAYLLV